MTEHIPVEGKIGLYRDSDSTAIINRDKKAYLDYMKRKKIAEGKNSELDKMKEIDDEWARNTAHKEEIAEIGNRSSSGEQRFYWS